jgi:hypothetical protein
MVSRRKVLVPLLAGLMLFMLIPQNASAAITGNTYYFAISWLDQTSQIDGGPVFVSSVDGQFAITVLNVTEIGGDDAYVYNYNGFTWLFSPITIDHNDTVQFQDNKVYFDLHTTDSDSNNRSESTSLSLYPGISTSHPGRNIFVNPVWSTHDADWNTAVNEAEAESTVASIASSISEGSFSFTIVVDIESEDADYGNLTGTETYTFSASYDTDGILSSWSLSARALISNENHTIDSTATQRITRTSGTGGGLSSDMTTQIAIMGGVAVVGIIVGVVIGKKYWG